MDDLIRQFAGSTDLAVCAGIGIIVALVLTQAVKAILNAEHWGPLRNPWAGCNTDRIMPLVALGIGALYGCLSVRGDSVGQNLALGLQYGGWSIVAHNVVKKTLLNQ